MDIDDFMAFTQRTRAIPALGVLVVLGALVILGGLLSSVYTVDADSEAVVLRLGTIHGTSGPGLHFRIPFGVDKVMIVPVRKVETIEFGFQTVTPGRRSTYRSPPNAQDVSLMLTGDLNCALVEWIVQYRIKNSSDYLFSVVLVEDTVRDAAESVVRGLVGDRSVDEVITTGREELGFEAREMLQDMLDNKYACGVEIVALKLQNATPPDEVRDAFDAVNRARQEKDTVINEAESERNKLIPAARGKRDREVAEAMGYADKIIKEANGETAAFLAQLAEYEKAKEVTRTRLFLQTMEEVLSKCGRCLIVDEKLRGILPILDLKGKGGER